MLKVEDINVFYGTIQALRGISFEVKEGEIVTLIGANGAGKTTTLRTLSGLMHPKTGTITFLGQNILKCDPSKIVEMGLCLRGEGYSPT